MIFIISRASDSFRTETLPSPNYPPHPEAVWDHEMKDWVIEIENVNDFKNMCKINQARLVISKDYNCLRLEIDDVTDCLKRSA